MIGSYRSVAEKEIKTGLTTSTNIQNYFVDFSNNLARKKTTRLDNSRVETRGIEKNRSNQVTLLKMADEKIQHAKKKLNNIKGMPKEEAIKIFDNAPIVVTLSKFPTFFKIRSEDSYGPCKVTLNYVSSCANLNVFVSLKHKNPSLCENDLKL